MLPGRGGPRQKRAGRTGCSQFVRNRDGLKIRTAVLLRSRLVNVMLDFLDGILDRPDDPHFYQHQDQESVK